LSGSIKAGDDNSDGLRGENKKQGRYDESKEQEGIQHIICHAPGLFFVPAVMLGKNRQERNHYAAGKKDIKNEIGNTESGVIDAQIPPGAKSSRQQTVPQKPQDKAEKSRHGQNDRGLVQAFGPRINKFLNVHIQSFYLF